MFSNSILLPIYVIAGRDRKEEVASLLQKLTLINASDHYKVIWVVFFFVVAYSMFGHIMIFFFDDKRKQFQVQLNQDVSEITDHEISLHSVLMRGINRELTHGWVEGVLNKIFVY